jgi:Predicted nucleic acid-binding protein, contains PIN domain
MIADTSFLIDLLRGEGDAVEKAGEIEKENKAYSLAAPTVYELWMGVVRSNSNEKEEILDIIESQIIHDLDKKSSFEAGKIQRKLIEKGERIGHLDALISGITRNNGNKILTRNVEEFKRVDNLEVESC